MTAIIPNVEPKGWYELKEAAAALGVDKSTLCRYQQKGFIRCSHRKHNGRRIYSGSEIIRFWRSNF